MCTELNYTCFNLFLKSRHSVDIARYDERESCEAGCRQKKKAAHTLKISILYYKIQIYEAIKLTHPSHFDLFSRITRQAV